MRDLVFVSLERWDEIWRRNQFVCAELARRHPDLRILFVEPPRDLSRAVRTGRMSAARDTGARHVTGYPGITRTRPPKLLPNTLKVGRRVNEAFARAHVRGTSRGIGIRAPILWLNPHDAVHMAGRMGESGVVYDITDDWTLTRLSDRERSLTLEQDRRLCARADLTVVCSEALHHSRKGRCRSILLVPNGVDADHYDCVTAPVSASERRWPAPAFGYTGTLHPERIDLDIILDLARCAGSGSVVLIGPDHLDAASRRRLEEAANVYLTGPLPYRDVPAAMRHFDVCIVPHVETPFTESLNPIKLWEYLAAGKPIVSTNVAGFRDYPGLAMVASGSAAFADTCLAATTEGESVPARRRAEARRHSWQARIDMLEQALRERDLW